MEKKESLFNATSGFVLTLMTEAEYNKNKDNLNNAPVFTRLYVFYNHEAPYNRVYQINGFLNRDGQINIDNPTSLNIIIKKDSPNGEALGFIAPYSINSIIKLETPNTYNLFPVFIKYNPFTNELTKIVPVFSTRAKQNKPYFQSFNLMDSTPNIWNLSVIASSIDFEMTTGGVFS